jgi:hypothetical protein
LASGATAPGPAFEGAPRFRPKVVHKQETILRIMKKTKFVRQVAKVDLVGRIPIEIPILWPHAVMVSPRPSVLLTGRNWYFFMAA